MRISQDDCALLSKYCESKPWNDIPEDDKASIKELRDRLKSLATDASENFAGATDVREFASHPTPNGRTPKELWCCIYPREVPNKSYGLQIALIVMDSGVEICFCLGSGSGQIGNADLRQQSETALAHLRLGLQRLPLEMRQQLADSIGNEWAYRKKWKLEPSGSEFQNINDWLEFASTSSGGGASISRYWTPEQLTGDVDLVREFQSACELFQPLLDAAYAPGEQVTANDESPFVSLMRQYADQRVVFLSPTKDKRYFVSEVDDAGCIIQRLDSNKPERVTATGYESRRDWLRDKGGTAKREELDNTVARHMCYLQASDLCLEADRRTAAYLPDSQSATDQFISLIRSMQTVTLYKPVILTLVIEAVRSGELTENRITFDWLLPRFLRRLRDHGSEVGEQQLAEGFGRMTADLFWLHAHNDPNEPISSDKPTPSQIRERISHARLHEAFWQAIQEPLHGQQVLAAIASKWWPDMTDNSSETGELAAATEQLIENIAAQGFIYQPWQIATYITALRTKPFVILAGVSGTGKSKLPKLVAELTGGNHQRISVRPDWTDSSDVLGYIDLQDRFRPGVFLQAAQRASADPGRYHVSLIDEMNLARVEHYFAEVLSTIEDRHRAAGGGYESGRLFGQNLSDQDASWAQQNIPANLGVVGTVNMDESSHGFSRKVLDRAFTIELSEVDLSLESSGGDTPGTLALPEWPVSHWHCLATRLSEIDHSSPRFRASAETATALLQQINDCLVHSQLQVGYRTRDEVILFLINAADVEESFRTREGAGVDPLDLAIMMKVLPRLVGGSNAIRRTLIGLMGLASAGQPLADEDEANNLVDRWDSDTRPDAISEAKLPRTAARLCLMWDRLMAEGYTSFWL